MTLHRTEMRTCGRRWPTQEAAEHSKLFLAGGKSAVPCLFGCGGWHLADETGTTAETGFPPAVKLMIRVRAGLGNPEDARCEACGIWVGAKGGQCHHRQNRGMGGSRLRNTVSNGGLLCGTPPDLATCHGKATALKAHMIAAGWVLKSGQDPLLVPVMLFSLDGGISPVWLAPDGSYSFGDPSQDSGRVSGEADAAGSSLPGTAPSPPCPAGHEGGEAA